MRSCLLALLVYFLVSIMGTQAFLAWGVPKEWAAMLAMAASTLVICASTWLEMRRDHKKKKVEVGPLTFAPPTDPTTVEFGPPFVCRTGNFEMTITPALQCVEDCPYEGQRCQGPHGHGGMHWAYLGSGDLVRWSEFYGVNRFSPDSRLYVPPHALQYARYTSYHKRTSRCTQPQKDQ